jgi:hypothetical protein
MNKKLPNIVLRGRKGELVIFDCDGNVTCVPSGQLAAKVESLMMLRQKAGVAISKALEKAGFQVCAQQESLVIEATEPSAKAAKKAAKSKKKAKSKSKK